VESRQLLIVSGFQELRRYAVLVREPRRLRFKSTVYYLFTVMLRCGDERWLELAIAALIVMLLLFARYYVRCWRLEAPRT